MIMNEHVDVYWNVKRKKWSVRNRQTRLVIDHLDHVRLRDASFSVSEKGRARVIRDQKKHVHAYVLGYVVPSDGLSRKNMDAHEGFVQVRYNPYETATFVTLGGEPVMRASDVFLTKGRVFVSHDYKGD